MIQWSRLSRLFRTFTATAVLGAALGHLVAPTPTAHAAAPEDDDDDDGAAERLIELVMKCHEDEDGNVSTSISLYINGVLVGSGGLAEQCINAEFSV